MKEASVTTKQQRTPAKSSNVQTGREHTTASDVSNPQIQHVCFMLAGSEYGVDISLVKEIIKPTIEPTPVPQSPFFVEGVIDLRGDIIPIIDLKKRFGIQPVEGVSPTRILVIKVGDIIVGFLVDSVTEVIRVRKSEIQEAPGKVVGVDAEYIWGVTKRNQNSPLIMLLDIERILWIDRGEEPLRAEKPEMT